MITHIRTVGFKGFDLNEAVPLKVIYSGKNKSGKSTRAGAIAIALYGHIPFSTAGKLPGDILDSFGDGILLDSAVTINGTEFGRKFMRNEKGGVSQSVQLDKKKTSKENFAMMLGKSGAPKIADVAEFMKQSEAKKIDTLFDLFPNDALAGIDSEIEKAKEDVSRLEKKKSGAESVVVRLTNSKQAIEIPAGSIAEVQDEINKTETLIVQFEEQIKQAEIEEARIEGEQKGKEQAETKVTSEVFTTNEIQTIEENFLPGKDLPLVTVHKSGFNQGESIERIIDALTGAGCGTCAALIVAKQELKKFKGVL